MSDTATKATTGAKKGETTSTTTAGKGTSSAPMANYVDVSDGTWTFRVRSNQNIEIIAGPSATGRVYTPQHSSYQQVLSNLLAIPGNEAKIRGVIPEARATVAPSSPGSPMPAPSASSGGSLAPVFIPSGAEGTAPVVTESVPLTQRSWFLPAVVVGGSVLLVAGAWYFSKRN